MYFMFLHNSKGTVNLLCVSLFNTLSISFVHMNEPKLVLCFRTSFVLEIKISNSMVTSHLSGLSSPTSQFLNGMHEFSELILVRMTLLVDQSRSVLLLRSAKALERLEELYARALDLAGKNGQTEIKRLITFVGDAFNFPRTGIFFQIQDQQDL